MPLGNEYKIVKRSNLKPELRYRDFFREVFCVSFFMFSIGFVNWKEAVVSSTSQCTSIAFFAKQGESA